MPGDIEHGQCDICKKDADLNRKVYYYPVKCECHEPQHFEIVRHCKDCEPVEPETTQVIHKTSELSQKWAHLRLLKQPGAFSHPLTEVFLHNQETGKVTTVGGDESPEEDIWEQLERFTGSIKDEIKSNNPDPVAIDFWLFKIDRRVELLKEHLTKEK